MVDRKIIEVIKNYIAVLNEKGFEIKKAYLYGSYASGNSHKTSDIDLMLISENLDENDMTKKSLAWTLTRKIDTRIEPYLVSLSRFYSDDSSPLLEIIRKEGLEIKFQADYLNEPFEDFEPS